MKNYPKIYNNDIKVLGRVVSIATENKVAAAEQIFDEKFKYIDLDSYSWDNVDLTQAGLDQYTINRLFGKKLKKLDDTFQFDEDGWIIDLKVRTLEADNLKVNNTATIKDLHVTNNAQFDGNVNIAGNLVVNNTNIGDKIDQLFRIVSGEDKTSSIWQAITALQTWKSSVDTDITWLKNKVNELLACCETVQEILRNLPSQGGVTIEVIPNPINITVGDPDVSLSVSSNPSLAGSYTVTSNNTSVATIVNGKVHAVAPGSTTITIEWGGVTKDVPVNISAPAKYTLTYMDGNTTLATQQYEAGQSITPIANPTKEGYTFNGWSPSIPATMPANDINVIAQWEEIVIEYSLTLNPTEMTMLAGDTQGIIATRKTNSVVNTDGSIAWSSSNENVATVDRNGTVTAVGTGTATITAAWTIGPSATCIVTVTENHIQPQSLTIVCDDPQYQIVDGVVDIPAGTQNVVFTAVIEPSNADINTEIGWEVLESTSGNYTSNGNKFTFSAWDKTGICNLKASTPNNLSDQILINVVSNTPEPEEHVYYIELNKPSETITSGGEGFTLSATLRGYYNGLADQIIPNTNEVITWTSSNTNAATVTSPGSTTTVSPVDNLTGNATATITAHWTDPNGDEQTKDCVVTVLKKPVLNEYTLTAFPTTLNLTVNGDPERVELTIIPKDEASSAEHMIFSPDIRYHSHGTDNPTTPGISIDPAAEVDAPNGRDITFYGIVAGSDEVLADTGHAWDELTVDDWNNTTLPKCSVTVKAITNAEPTPNEHKAIFFDPNLAEGEVDQYTSGGGHPQMVLYPNAYKLGETTFFAGSREQDFQFLTDEQAKAAALANGHNKAGYRLSWDMGLYDPMPDRDIYVKAIWDPFQRDIIYKDGDTVLGTETYTVGQTVDPQVTATKEGYTFRGWIGLPSDMKMPGTDEMIQEDGFTKCAPLTVTADWAGGYAFTVDPTEINMYTDHSPRQITARLNGSAVSENVTWTSSDENVASVSATGQVSVVNVGTATITATTSDERASNNTATCSVTISRRNPSFSHGGSNPHLSLCVGESEDFQELVINGQQGYRVIWEDYDPSICEVTVKQAYGDVDGSEIITVKAISPGSVSMHARLVDSEGNDVYQTNSSGQSMPTRSDIVYVTVYEDPIVTVQWETDEHSTLSNTSSQNNVAEFEPITLDANGDAVYHNWESDINVDSGYKVKDVTVKEYWGTSQFGVADYRNWYGNIDVTNNRIVIDAKSILSTRPIKITVTTEEE